MKKYLQGIEDASPRLVGFARGAIEAGVMAALAYCGAHVDVLVSALPTLPIPTEAIAPSALFMWIIRSSEGWADHTIDPSQNRTPLAPRG